MIDFTERERMDIDIDKIDLLNHLYDRRVEDYTTDQSLFSLAGSIEKNGLAHPIVVTRGSGDRFILIVGKRRLGAWKMLQKKFEEDDDSRYAKIPATVITATASDGLAIAIDENSERKIVREVGYMNLAYATICSFAECLDSEDNEDEVSRKGLSILMYYYYKITFGKDAKKYLMRLPCEPNVAIRALDAFLETTRTTAGNLVRKAKLIEMPSDFIYAIDLKWVTQKDIYRFYKTNKKNVGVIEAIDLKIKELKRKKSDVAFACEQLSTLMLEVGESVEQKVLLPKREYNKLKRQQENILKQLSFFDKSHPKLKAIKDHIAAIESIINKE